MDHLLPKAPDWRAYLARGALRDDVLAGFIVSVLLIPQSLAYAMLAGLPPDVGLYASLLPALAYALMGSSPVLAIGPVAVLALMIMQALGGVPAGFSAEQGALVLAAETGLVLLAAAVLRLDALASLMSVPVLHGFETGATVSIALSQLPVLLGSPAKGSDAIALWQTAQGSGWAWTAASAAFGLFSCVLLYAARRFLHGSLARLAPLALLLGSMAVAALTDAGSRGVALVGQLPALHAPWSLPPLDASLWRALLPSALLLGLMAYVSSLVVTESLARRRGEKVNARAELRGLGAANLVAAFGSGMPVSGSFSRSVLLHDAGSRSRMSGVFVAGFMGLAMLLLTGPLAWLPKAVLAGTILVAVLSGFSVTPYRRAWRYARSEAVLMLFVTLLVVFDSVSVGLAAGVLGSIGLLLQRTAQPHVARIGRVQGTEHFRNVGRYKVEEAPHTLSLRIDESLVFINARSLADVVQGHLEDSRREGREVQRVLLLMSPINAIDFSGLEALRALHDGLQAQGLRLDLSEIKGPVLDRLRAGRWERWFKGDVFMTHHLGLERDPPSA
ncbi:MAG: STAS domain-containing protein [Paucibacter sp.]|nr:STAS domain-containing protein [Roseateles sp.]